MGNAKRSKTSKVSSDVKAKSRGVECSVAPPAISPILSKGQLNTLILLAFAASRILQIGGARTDLAPDDSDTSSNQACVAHLGEEACGDAAIQSLLTIKYESALYVLAVAVAVILPIWSSSLQLLRLDSVLVVAPLFLVVSALSFFHALAQATKTSNILVAALLMVLAAPMEYRSVPFLHGRFSHVTRGSRLPSLALVVLFVVKGQALLDQAKACMELFQPTETPDVDARLAPLASPALTIMVFLLIDRVTELCLYLFAWYEHSRSQQATTMLFLALVQGVQYYLSLADSRSKAPSEIVPMDKGSAEMTRTLVLAVLCGLAWLAPEMAWKGKSKSH